MKINWQTLERNANNWIASCLKDNADPASLIWLYIWDRLLFCRADVRSTAEPEVTCEKFFYYDYVLHNLKQTLNAQLFSM